LLNNITSPILLLATDGDGRATNGQTADGLATDGLAADGLTAD